MITLCGFAISNYYNKVKLALLEKGIAFSEETVLTGSTDEAVLSVSPLAKVPFVRTPDGPLCESQVIVDWLEVAHPEPAGGFSLPRPGVDDDQPLLALFPGHDLVPRGLLLRHLAGMPGEVVGGGSQPGSSKG